MFSWFLRLIRQALSFSLARGRPVQLGLQDIPAPARGGPLRWRGPDRPPGDPRSRVREPKPDRPYDRSGAVSVVEPDESEVLSAVAAAGARKTTAR
jgi:hypothetical protein